MAWPHRSQILLGLVIWLCPYQAWLLSQELLGRWSFKWILELFDRPSALRWIDTIFNLQVLHDFFVVLCWGCGWPLELLLKVLKSVWIFLLKDLPVILHFLSVLFYFLVSVYFPVLCLFSALIDLFLFLGPRKLKLLFLRIKVFLLLLFQLLVLV